MQCQMCDRALGHNEAGYRVSMWQGHAGYKSFYAVSYIYYTEGHPFRSTGAITLAMRVTCTFNTQD